MEYYSSEIRETVRCVCIGHAKRVLSGLQTLPTAIHRSYVVYQKCGTQVRGLKHMHPACVVLKSAKNRLSVVSNASRQGCYVQQSSILVTHRL